MSEIPQEQRRTPPRPLVGLTDASPRHPASLFAELAGRWQIPLLVLSLVMLGWGVWRLKPAPRQPAFDDLFSHAVALKETTLYPEASEYVTKLLEDTARSPEEMQRLHGLLAEVIFAFEQGNAVHGENNTQRILEHSDKLVELGGVLDAKLYEMRASAWEWLKRPVEAVGDYKSAIERSEAGTPHVWELRKRTIEIERTIGGLEPRQLQDEFSAFLTGKGVSDELRYWAAEQKVEQWEQEGQHAKAEQFLSAHALEFDDPMWRKSYQYLQALSFFHAGRIDDAERLLRGMRDQLAPGHTLFARSGWLLGKVLQAQESPEFALGFFNDVYNNTLNGQYRTASCIGRAETLAALDRFDESGQAYAETLRLAAEDPYGSMVDLQVIRESTSALYQSMLAQGRLAEAMAYLRIAAKLAPPSDDKAQVLYSQRLADLALALGKQAQEGARERGGEGAREGERDSASLSSPSRPLVHSPTLDSRAREAKDSFIEAGEEFLHLAKLMSLDDDGVASAVWHAADAFDLAGMRTRTADVLEDFVRDQPGSTRAPMALLRLGQTYQATGDYAKAIDAYERNLIDFPRTPSAVASLVPLAECFLDTGANDKAEETLLRIVTRHPNDPMTLITPAAGEYRDALFGLGDLYARIGEYEKSIARYEEAVERYPGDSRSDRATYLLADAYLRNASRIRDDLADQKNAAHRDELRTTYQKRLLRARQLFDAVIARYQGRPESSLSELDQLYLKLSYFYRADAVYDISRVGEQADLRAYAEALELYDRAAWLYQTDPMAMTAYIQMINCYLWLGNTEKARMALQRARWTLKGIADERFVKYTPEENRAFWENYLSWLERTPTLANEALAKAG